MPRPKVDRTPRVTVQMRLDVDLLAQIDAARAKRRQTRTAFVVAAVLDALESAELGITGRVVPRSDDARASAHRAVWRAVADGVLPPLSECVCADCGKSCDGISTAGYHHDKGYEPKHWLSVVPLCTKCHVARHRAEGEPLPNDIEDLAVEVRRPKARKPKAQPHKQVQPRFKRQP